MYVEYNPNPCGRRVGDCAVRALSKALGVSWESAYIMLAMNGLQMCDAMNADSVIGATLRQNGFERRAVPTSCPDCYDVAEFCKEYPTGMYVLFLGGHIVCVKDGDLFDAWDSSREVVQYFWTREEV